MLFLLSWGYINRIQICTWMQKLGMRPRSFISGNICLKFSVQCICCTFRSNRRLCGLNKMKWLESSFTILCGLLQLKMSDVKEKKILFSFSSLKNVQQVYKPTQKPVILTFHTSVWIWRSRLQTVFNLQLFLSLAIRGNCKIWEQPTCRWPILLITEKEIHVVVFSLDRSLF